MIKNLFYIILLLFYSCQARYFSETHLYAIHEQAPEKIVRLDLSHQNLQFLPNDIQKYSRLQFINLSNNPNLQLDSVFNVLATFTQLKMVRLDSNNIVDLSDNCKKLKNVTHLSLVYNPHFNLQKNTIKLSEMPKLTTLNFEHCNFTEVPATISSIKLLQNLRLSHNNINTAISFIHLAQIKKLKFLWLDNNKITVLPPEISQLTQVVELYLDNNQLFNLPDEIKSCENLCILYLGNNQFKEIPEQIMDMKMMYMLVLYNNQIETIPEKFAHTKAPLAVLVLDKNRLSEAEIKTATNYFKGFFLFSTKNQQIIGNH